MKVTIYRIGPEMEDDHYAILKEGVALRYPTGELTVGTLRQATQEFLAVTGLPPDTNVDVRGRAVSVREAEIKERQEIIAGLATPQLLAALMQRPDKTLVTITADGGWQFGPSVEPIPEERGPVIWRTEVSPTLYRAAKEAFIRLVAGEAAERIDRVQNTQTKEYA